ncbi:hypothetical protein L226DRAFT_217806 [Lentinus tigrinus ALCF2SS1-7]|uniref:Fungal-type protein kinase domain-containing protein n=1 Tax=Lentinus tigrinus ALCF2SS1-6 TaxID=1328759 RepID=A0A5C2S9I1_9APHY|nr:hypothetical protein L227DRAFT_100916 [Lentinus tigrinus ALCF2SS1-6]RPD70921.1 hypothetical protein L226DRAFT_217806 [Lentinus tigrinus ALCF2SS1-7]
MRSRRTKDSITLDETDFSGITLDVHPIRNTSSYLSDHWSRDKVTKSVVEECTYAQRVVGTPMKGSGRAPSEMVRAHVEERLVQELVSRQWISQDLVNHALGDLVPLHLAAHVLYLFLSYDVLSVATKESPQEDILRDRWPEVCARAVFLTAVQQGSVQGETDGQVPTDNYVWRWHSDLRTDTEGQTADFLNIVGTLAYVCAMTVDDSFETRRRPAVRFSTVPNPHGALPLPHDKQDLRPDLIALPYMAFRQSQSSAQAPGLVKNTRILPFIRARFPGLFLESVDSVDDVFAPTEASRPRTPSSLHINSYTLPTGPKTGSFEDLLAQLSHFAESNPQPRAFSSELQTMFDADAVDISYACWPGILVTGENKQSNIISGTMQELVYMQHQRCTQPYLRFVLGFAFTKDEAVLLRADAIGTERHRMRKDSSTGVLELIQMVLGLTLADDGRLGVHPGFEFQEVTRPFSTSKEAPPTQYRHREAVYLNIDPDSASGDASRYYLDYVVDNRGSLSGRRTVVWSAWREVEACDASICDEHVTPNSRDCVFVGPYALKMHYADINSRAQRSSIEEGVKGHADKGGDGAQYVLLPKETWFGELVHQSVRGFAHEEDIPESVRSGTTIRREIISISPLKRTLAQYQNVAELVRALVDVFRAIKWLVDIGYVHRDISMGNILLAREEPSTFRDPQERTFNLGCHGNTSIVTTKLVRRKKHGPIEVIGLLHDFDMAGLVKPPPEEEPRTAEKSRTGTPPYMSIDVLVGDHEYHMPCDDMQSVFYVAYLFAFTYDAPAPTTYPSLPTSPLHRWPDAINRWAYGSSLYNLGAAKTVFFQLAYGLERWLESFEKQTLQYWVEGSQHKLALKKLLMVLHDQCLWYLPPQEQHKANGRFLTDDVAPSLVVETLSQFLAENKELYRFPR